MQNISILNLNKTELSKKIAELELPAYTTKQLLEWIYQKKVADFQKMSNIPKNAREKLNKNFMILPFESIAKISAKDKLSTKYIFKLFSGEYIESVLLQEKDYQTLCISSQAGCPLDCKFCLTGYVGFKKNLDLAEILGQVLAVSKDHNISHLVFMGMGEPFLNLDNVLKSISILNSPDFFNISNRKITVSTVGILEGIERLIQENITLNLAFSVGIPNPLKRIRIIPNEKKNPILKVIKLLHQYQQTHNRKLTLEYTLIEGLNDTDEDLKELANLAKYLYSKINLINLNSHPKIPYKPVGGKAIKAFKNKLSALGTSVTIRSSKGYEIVAGCGQLGESLL